MSRDLPPFYPELAVDLTPEERAEIAEPIDEPEADEPEAGS